MSQRLLITLLALSLIFLIGRNILRTKPISSKRIQNSKYSGLAKYIEAMARHESGNYTNRLSKQFNNIFSMGFPTVRPSVNIGSSKALTQNPNEPSNWSVYKSYDQAIEDLLLWFDWTKFPTNISDPLSFATALKSRSYYTDSLANYYNGIKNNLS